MSAEPAAPMAEWVHISYQEQSEIREVYGFSGTQGTVHLEGIRFSVPDRPSRTLLIFMHPTSTLQLLPVPRAMAEAGLHVLCAGSRYARNDTPLIMEKVLLDYAAFVRHAREVWGYEKIIVGGWSGGGSLAAFYQGQAERPTVGCIPSGEPIDLSDFLPGDAMIWQAAHLSRADMLADFIDPSVLDEYDPTRRNPELDLYDPRNPNQPPYSSDYLAYFRAAQKDRLGRRTALVKELLNDIRTGRTGEMERALVLHRTLADPRWLDPSIEFNDRRPGWCFLGDPRMSNSSPAGVARFSTLRAWLSQWSLEDTQARALDNAPMISVPLLCIENTADDAVPQPHTRRFHDAAGSSDKTLAVVRGANHYYAGQPEQLAEAVDLVVKWLRNRNLIET
jgi:pimeloyl-ACP methyl ester carboxylesterase